MISNEDRERKTRDNMLNSLMCSSCGLRHAECLMNSPVRIHGVLCDECRKIEEPEIRERDPLIDQYLKVFKVSDLNDRALEVAYYSYGESNCYEGL